MLYVPNPVRLAWRQSVDNAILFEIRMKDPYNSSTYLSSKRKVSGGQGEEGCLAQKIKNLCEKEQKVDS